MTVLNSWLQSKKLALQERIALLHKLRLRAFAIVVGLVLAVVGIMSVISAPAWTVVAGAFAIAAVAVNTVASRLTKSICIGCGQNLAEQPVGQYGAVCPNCGTISTPADAMRLAQNTPRHHTTALDTPEADDPIDDADAPGPGATTA